MNQASLYQRANQVQRHDAKQILNEYAHVLQWREDGKDTLIDVGSGSGNVLIDFVHPLLPKNYGLLMGSDVSQKMVTYASKCYQHYERTKFQVLDIGCENLTEDLVAQFDHVTSFYCLHWVQNQRLALENIYKLLRDEGGDCLLVFLASNPVYDAYRVLAKNPKWSKYMHDVQNFISPLHDSKDPRSDFSHLLSEVGFTDHNVELRNEVYMYEGVQTLKDNVQAICPFLERMPVTLHEKFMDDYVSTVIDMNLREESSVHLAPHEQRFLSPYTLLVVYARKSGDFVRSVLGSERNSRAEP